MSKKVQNRIWWGVVCVLAVAMVLVFAFSGGSDASPNETQPETTATIAETETAPDVVAEPAAIEATAPITTIPEPETLPENTEPTVAETEADVVEETEPATASEATKDIVITTEPTEAPVIVEDSSDLNMDDVEMLACVIYQEMGSDSCCDNCRRRVADVVLNRVADSRFPNTIYGVLTQSGQYGRFAWTGIVWPGHASSAGEAHAVERAYRIAREVLSGQHSEVYGCGYIWQAEFTQGYDNIYCCGCYFGRG